MPVPFTLADLQNRAGEGGVDLRLDDEPTDGGAAVDPADALTSVQDDAAAEVGFYLGHRYDTTTAAYFANPWVKSAHIACGIWLLCQRRLNNVPDAVQKRWDAYLKKLESILEGKGNSAVPGLAERKGSVPVVTNYRWRGWPYPQALPQRQHSTGTPEGYTRNDDQTEPPPVR